MRATLRVVAFLLAAAMFVPAAGAAQKEKKAAKSQPVETAKASEEAAKFRYGADLRVREEYFDNIPIIDDPPGVTRGGENNYFRFRPRIWAEADVTPKVTLRARALTEWREWEDPDMAGQPQRASWEWQDEWVFDHLYVDLRDVVENLDLRIGRQDLIYGTGKVILEGNPKDGSRTIYFNAAKATWKGMKDAPLDAFFIYNQSLDELAIDDAERDLTGQTSANDDITESGGGLYWKNNVNKEMPFELYGIYKNESDWQSGPATSLVSHEELDLGTVGFRLMPQFSDRLSGNLEAAYQLGEQGDVDVEGYMVDAFLTWKAPVLEDMKPAVSYGLYCLSGDDPSSEDDEGWNPLWARYPQFSELYVYAFDAEGAGRWSNLTAPHVDLVLSPLKWLKTTAMLYYMWAPEENGPGGGNERGWLGVLKGEFTIGENLLCKRDKLTGHLLLELLEPGDYYNVDDTALFARWELMYAF